MFSRETRGFVKLWDANRKQEAIRNAIGIKAVGKPAYLTHCPFRELIDGTVATNLMAIWSQGNVRQALPRGVDEFPQITRERFAVKTILLVLDVIVVKVGEEGRKVREFWGRNGGMANA